jgi:hypothetical protein
LQAVITLAQHPAIMQRVTTLKFLVGQCDVTQLQHLHHLRALELDHLGLRDAQSLSSLTLLTSLSLRTLGEYGTSEEQDEVELQPSDLPPQLKVLRVRYLILHGQLASWLPALVAVSTALAGGAECVRHDFPWQHHSRAC